jgi:hypothetical protein
MKKLIVLLFTVSMFAASAAFAADKPAKEVTLTGMGQCAKCSLGVTKECQTAVVVTKGGKDETYLLTDNDVAKKFHDNVCESVKPVKVTGKVSEVDGKKQITASKIELVKS